MNLEEAMNLLYGCADMEQLASVWKTNAARWSKEFKKNEAEQIIAAKEKLKTKLSMPVPSDLDRECDRLLQLYPDIGWQKHREKWGRLYSIPGWREELRNLQMGFLENYDDGSNCYSEFEALRLHWQEGRTCLAQQSDGKRHV